MPSFSLKLPCWRRCSWLGWRFSTSPSFLWPDAQRKGVFPRHPRVRRIAPSQKGALVCWSEHPRRGVAITTKRFWCEGVKKKQPLYKHVHCELFLWQAMVNTHLPVALKLINSAALVAIALSTLCAAGSLREIPGRSAAPTVVTEVN